MSNRTRALALVSCLLALACSSPGPGPHDAARAPAAADGAFPPTGPVSLAARPAPAAGALYQLVILYQGRTEASFATGPRAQDEPQTVNELLQMELDYHQVPVAAPSSGEIASSLVLDALRRRSQSAPPPAMLALEAGDDRVRTQREGKVEVDLRGAQPKGDMTPRTILNKPFGLLVTDAEGNPKGVTLRGIPSAKKMLTSMPIREAVSYVQVNRPTAPIAAGATWSAKRFLASPIGRLGVAADVEHRLVGFEEIDGVRCAHVSLRAQRDDANVTSERGMKLEQVRLEYGGDAWIELDTGLVRLLRLEDIAAVSYERNAPGAPTMRMRSRYETRASLKLLDLETTTGTWADGTKRFADVK